MSKNSDLQTYSRDHDDMPPGLVRTPAKAMRAPVKKVLARKVTTLTLTSRTCKWPIGDPSHADFHYCGQLPEIGRPYCPAHGSMSYQTPQRKKPA